MIQICGTLSVEEIIKAITNKERKKVIDFQR